MSKYYQEALALFNNNERPKALKLIRKEKSHTFMSKKLHMALEFYNNNFVRTLALGKELLVQTEEIVHLREIYYLLAVSSAQVGKFNDSVDYLEESIKVDSTISNAKAYFELLTLYNRLENYARVEELAPKLGGWQQYFLVAQIILLDSAAKSGKIDLLKDRLNKISHYFTELSKKQLATVLGYLVNTNLFELADRAIELYEKKFKIQIVGPRINSLLKQNKYQEVVDLVDALENKDYLVNEHVCYITAHANHGLKNYEDAFEWYEKGAKIVKKKVSKGSYHDFIPSFQKLISKIPKERLEGSEGEKNVFVFGFPRSGTTLLDNILDTQDALVLSERNIVTGIINELKFNQFKYPKDLYKLTNEQILELRNAYYHLIEKRGFSFDKEGVIIEKGPHYTEMLPLIKMLFPSSKLVCTIRHPLDVVLSCFQQNFELNSYNAKLTLLEDIVDRYVKVFSLLEEYEERLGIEVHYIRYEDLVEDIEGEMSKVFDYIGMEPDNSYLEFHKHAANKYVTSASRGQTDKALFTTSMYKWKKYEKQLAPFKSKLQYFITKFGYED